MADDAGVRHARIGGVFSNIVAALEIGVLFDGVDLLENENLLPRRCFQSGGEEDDIAHPFGITNGEVEGQLAAGRAAQNGVGSFDTEIIQQFLPENPLCRKN